MPPPLAELGCGGIPNLPALADRELEALPAAQAIAPVDSSSAAITAAVARQGNRWSA